MNADWACAHEALERAQAKGRVLRVWLRDDDAVAATPQLERLAALCAEARLPILLAVIPLPAEPGLAAWIATHPGVIPCQHGFAHANHAAAGERARELGGRPAPAILAELARGRAKLKVLFGDALSDVLVPPWNRIDAALEPHLSELGFSAVSAFGPAPETSSIAHLDSDLDIIDWRGGRIGRTAADLSRRLAALVDRRDVVGILTHHLAHDEAAWTGLAAMLELLGTHPAVRFTSATELVGTGIAPP